MKKSYRIFVGFLLAFLFSILIGCNVEAGNNSSQNNENGNEGKKEIETVSYPVRSVSAGANSASIVIVWQEPEDTSNFGGVKITWNSDSKTVNAGTTSAVISGLSASTEYTFKITTLDSSMNETDSSVSLSIETSAVKTETITKTEAVEKTYASAVTFTSSATDDGVSIAMATETDGATIYYTTDGTNPTSSSTKYKSEIEITSDRTIKAVAIKNGIENSPISVATVSIETKTVTVIEKIKITGDTGDTTPPGKVTNLSAICIDGFIALSWTNPSDDDFWGVIITATPNDGVFENEVYVVGANEYSCSNLTNGKKYTFSVSSVDRSLNKSETVTVTQTYNGSGNIEVVIY